MLILPSISYTVIGTGTRSRYRISTILLKIMLSIWGSYELFSTFFMLTLQLVFIRAGYLRHDSRNASRRHPTSPGDVWRSVDNCFKWPIIGWCDQNMYVSNSRHLKGWGPSCRTITASPMSSLLLIHPSDPIPLVNHLFTLLPLKHN